jgi:ATP-dependent Clp protease ATP-binding subunit ClpB
LKSLTVDKAIELNLLQQRIVNSSNTPFVFNVTSGARAFLLREGTNMKYGARHLKRAIERELVHPLSNLIASGQVHRGDLLRIDFDSVQVRLAFIKEEEDTPAYAMAQMIESAPLSLSAAATASPAQFEPLRVASAKSQRIR